MKRVLLTAGPDLFAGKAPFTPSAMVAFLARAGELLVVPSHGGFDFRRDLVLAHRFDGVGFEAMGWQEPRADVWLNFSDGVHADFGSLGFEKRRDFREACVAFYARQLARNHVHRLVNTLEAEARTLKSWLIGHALAIPTVRCQDLSEVHDLLKREGCLVAKLDWSASGSGVRYLDSESALGDFAKALAAQAAVSLADYVFQPLWKGPEKRFCFAGDDLAVSMLFRSKPRPWDQNRPLVLAPYPSEDPCHERDLARAKAIWQQTGLEFGSIDLLADRVLEINGAGTEYVRKADSGKIVCDGREALVDYLARLLETI